jgi:hypothetical protein
LNGIDATILFAHSLLLGTSRPYARRQRPVSAHLPANIRIYAHKLAQLIVSPPDATGDSPVTMNPILVTFLVIIGAGAAVMLGYAMSYLFLSKAGMSEHDKVRLEVAAGQDFSQPVYMAQVRDRNLRDMTSRTR